MLVLPLKAIPNQSLSIIVGDNQWDITLRDTNGCTSCSLVRNSEVIVENARVVAGMRILQARYQEDGNFAIISNNQTVPIYTEFGVSQFLVYISQAELDASAGVPDDLITAAFFDPLGGLPLRFAPQGYTVAAIARNRGVQFKPSAKLLADS